MGWRNGLLKVAPFMALGVLTAGCAVTRLQTAEEGVVVERAFLNRSPFGMDGTEVFLFRPAGKGPFPGVVLLHGDQPEPAGPPGGKEFFYDGTGEFLASKGYAVMAPSMPGFGDSTGERDFVGPETLLRLQSAITHFQRLPYVDSRRIALFGASRGATAAALLAPRIPGVLGLILQSGLYDLREVAKGGGKGASPKGALPKAAREMRDRIGREAGAFPPEMARRSPAALSGGLSCPVLLIHGTEDQTVSIEQMRRFAKALKRQMGKKCGVVTREVKAGHVLSGAVVWSEALPFLRGLLDASDWAKR